VDIIKINATAVKLQKDIRERLTELEPMVAEYKVLSDQLEIIEAAYAKIAKLEEKLKVQKPSGTYEQVKKWLDKKDPTDHFKKVNLVQDFDKSYTWANSMIKRLINEGKIETWGKGMYRKPPVKTGEAKLRVVTKGSQPSAAA
jgi:hypothetical protein